MAPRYGFDTTELELLVSDDVATVIYPSALDGGTVEIGGQFRLSFTVNPTPRFTWSFDPREAPGLSLCTDETASLRCRLPHAPELELRRTDTPWKLAKAVSLSGFLPVYDPVGDVDVRDVRFSVFNWGDAFGTTLIWCDSTKRSVQNRHQWSSEGWEIILDADPDLDQKWENAKHSREFVVTHCGRLTRTDKQPFLFSDAHEVLGCLHWFLSFVRGRRVGIALASGFTDDPGPQAREEPLITHWNVTQVDEAVTVQSWFTPGMERELGCLFQAFHRIWRGDKLLKRQLRTMISTYCVALDQSIPLEMQVLSGYIGLETETRKNLGKAELSKVLNKHHLPCQITDTVEGAGQKFNGAKFLASIRNDVVHQNTGGYPDVDQLWRASKTCLYFLELLILCKLGHEGTFCDRFRAKAVGEAIDMPPQGT